MSASIVTLELQDEIDEAAAALPAAPRRPPMKGEIVKSLSSRYVQLQDWAFTYEFVLVLNGGSFLSLHENVLANAGTLHG